MYLAGVAEFFFYRRGGGSLDELPEPRPGIRESPRRHFDAKRFERAKDAVCLTRIHMQASGIGESLHQGQQSPGCSHHQTLYSAMRNIRSEHANAGNRTRITAFTS